MSIKHFILPVAVFLAACSSPVQSEDGSSSEQDLGGSAITAGYYVFDKAEGSVDRWIVAVNLHVDGTYEGDFGDDVSNLSGLSYLADGTYEIDTKASTISFSQNGGTSDPYSYRIQNGALELKFSGEALAPQSWFSVAKEASPVTLTFGADWTATQSGALKAGGTALVRYAAARAQCAGNQAQLSLDYVIDGGTIGNEYFGAAFPSAPIDGYVDLLVTIPAGHDLAFHFKSSNGGCNGSDSDFGKNYHFVIE
jgi:hypothetical protein